MLSTTPLETRHSHRCRILDVTRFYFSGPTRWPRCFDVRPSFLLLTSILPATRCHESSGVLRYHISGVASLVLAFLSAKGPDCAMSCCVVDAHGILILSFCSWLIAPSVVVRSRSRKTRATIPGGGEGLAGSGWRGAAAEHLEMRRTGFSGEGRGGMDGVGGGEAWRYGE